VAEEGRPELPAIYWHTMLFEGNRPSDHRNNTSMGHLARQPIQPDTARRQRGTSRNRLDKDRSHKAMRNRTAHLDTARTNKARNQIRHRVRHERRRESRQLHGKNPRRRREIRHHRDLRHLRSQQNRMQQGQSQRRSLRFFSLRTPPPANFTRPSCDRQSPAHELNTL
jgi:hypothetical protein